MQFEIEATHLLKTITSRNLASERVEDIRLTMVAVFKMGKADGAQEASENEFAKSQQRRLEAQRPADIG